MTLPHCNCAENDDNAPDHAPSCPRFTTAFRCLPAQAAGTCEPFDDPRSHDFKGWVEFDEGRGGTAVCTKCGISAISHSMRYGP